jgi:carbon storage regulator
MLVLTRKPQEEIKIGKDIVVKVISISENSVKIGIEAPKEMVIMRAELYQKVKENNVEATKNVSLNLPENLKDLKVNKLNKRKNERKEKD